MLKKIAVASGIALALGLAGSAATVAFAENNGGGTTTPQSPAEMTVQIGPHGNVLLRGTLMSVTASSTLTVKSWGGTWTVNVPSGARVVPENGSLANFKAGDFVGVQGMISPNSSDWTVTAEIVRDWTAGKAFAEEVKQNKQEERSLMARNFEGVLSGLNASSSQSFMLASENKNFTVNLASGALLLTNSRRTLDWSMVKNGDRVRVYGTLASTTITASVFRDTSVRP